MAGNSRMHVEGDKELMALLMGLGKKANAINRAAVNKAGTPALQEAKANCPVDKGDLKKSLVKKTTNKGPRSQAKIGADADYVDGNGEKPSHYDHLVENGRVTPDVIDLVAMNEHMEFPYYYDEVKKRQGVALTSSVAEHCSAFVATGRYTKDGRIVIGHNNWSDYLSGSRWKVIFDIAPANGHHLIMDGMPGLIHSADDFVINDAGMMITETTISDFHGFDENGVPEFIRARKAMQYSESIDDFARIMEDGNNGGYANAWLVGDRKTNEIARLELGLKNVILERTKDGYYVGSNFPVNDKLGKEETSFPMSDPNAPNQCRHRRWDQLMEENKGKIDVEAGKRFETDHYDVITKEFDPNERTLCGHIDKSSRGMPGWQGPFGAAGAVEAKVADSAMAEKLSFVAGAGHPCGVVFDAKKHLKAHPEQAWQAPLLEDLKANPWTVVTATR